MILTNRLRRILFMINRATFRRRNAVTGIMLPTTGSVPVSLVSDVPANNYVEITVFGTVDAEIPNIITNPEILAPSTGVIEYIPPTVPAGNSVDVTVFGPVDMEIA